MIARSSDGVDVTVHDLGGQGASLLACHATGFHGRCYAPLAAALDGSFHVFAPDLRGHGMTHAPAGWRADWAGYADDVVAVAATLDRPLVGFGHSMGGACLVLAAQRRPELFTHLVLFEPIAFPSESAPPDGAALAAGARRRRATFPSIEAAVEHFASKPPMASFDPRVVRAYVEHGVEGVPDGVRLRCDPELEAATFEAGAANGVWEALVEITVPVTVLAGHHGRGTPAGLAARIAARTPAGTHVELAELDHFGPFTAPELVADRIVAAVAP